MSECEHERFAVNANVTRLTNDAGVVDGYSADIGIKCDVCGLPFAFKGVPLGYSPAKPMASPDRLELRAPLEPYDDSRH